MTDPAVPFRSSLGSAFAGAGATFSGIGLARFAYVPLFPAMVAAGWVSGGEAGLLGAVNLGGYLAGVLGGRSVARTIGTPGALHLGMGLAALSLAGCGWNGGLGWLAACRGGAGVAGGILMAIVGPAVQGAVPAASRGLAGGVVITGVATGVVAASLAVPLLLRDGVASAWLALAGLVALVWALAGRAWPATPVPAATRAPMPAGAVRLYAAYGISGAGLVPHMVYFGDLVVRGRGLDVGLASLAWLMFGLGGLIGPLAGGRAADRWGASKAMTIWLVVQVAALGLAFARSEAALLASACAGGFAAVGLTAVALARAREIAGAAAGGVWMWTTAAFALAQATTGFAFAALFAATSSHAVLFGAGLALSLAALVPAITDRTARR